MKKTENETSIDNDSSISTQIQNHKQSETEGSMRLTYKAVTSDVPEAAASGTIAAPPPPTGAASPRAGRLRVLREEVGMTTMTTAGRGRNVLCVFDVDEG